ncbi:HAD-IA family hydrolase [Streptomyces sp. NPDC057582]|uniref:HAD-IA family hydrolase n=1 Tax=Streptomyces sp. NPDC057582 TaxID=3346174 RepID=UPI00368A60D2
MPGGVWVTFSVRSGTPGVVSAVGAPVSPARWFGASPSPLATPTWPGRRDSARLERTAYGICAAAQDAKAEDQCAQDRSGRASEPGLTPAHCPRTVAKPDRKIYEITAERAGVAMDRCLFVDDRLENVDAAAALGMTGVHYRESEDLRESVSFLLDGQVGYLTHRQH